MPDNKPLEIGRDVPGTTEYFYGKLDDIKIFNRALTYQEVKNLYNFGSTTEIEADRYSTTPETFLLEQNYPNPFNPTTKIRYSIPNVGFGLAQTVLKVYDVLGNEVATLVNEEKPAGSYEVTFDASNLSSGIYFYKINAGSFSDTKKMILIK
ncbi:MAG: T9SS type A sorting domain-containing protein [Ignavibacterium sp.]